MKKFVVLLVVVALTLVTSAVMAAEVTVGGSLEVRSRNFSNMDMDDDGADTKDTQQRDTQTRVKIDVNAKAGDVKGKIQLWNDFESWADNGISKTFETQPGTVVTAQTGTTASYERNTLGFREAWISFPLPGTPVTVTGGHQLLTVGNGWFFRSTHFGSDAWVVSSKMGDNTMAAVNVKVGEGDVAKSDDTDAYVLLDVLKLSDAMSVGFDLAWVKDRRGGLYGTLTGDPVPAGTKADLQNIGLNFNGKLGPLALKAELDLQMGSIDVPGNSVDFKGNQLVLQGSMPLDPVTLNFTAAMGSGQDGGSDIKTYVNFLDIDPHYTFMYEYKMNTVIGRKNTGFANTTALSVGANFAATKSLTVGADLWWLQATEDVENYTATGTSSDIGTEIDVKVNWNVAENLTWNWVLGYFKPGDAMGADAATGIQGILAFKF